MTIAEARVFVGKTCQVTWRDRFGQERQEVTYVHEATFVPMYGAYVVTDFEDLRLDRIVTIREQEAREREASIRLPAAA